MSATPTLGPAVDFDGDPWAADCAVSYLARADAGRRDHRPRPRQSDGGTGENTPRPGEGRPPRIAAHRDGSDPVRATLDGPVADNEVETEFVVTCPYCGEPVEIYLEPDLMGTVVQDCEVCCRPWQLRVGYDDGQR